MDTKSDPWWTKNNASNMTEAHSMDELLQVLQANADKLVGGLGGDVGEEGGSRGDGLLDPVD